MEKQRSKENLWKWRERIVPEVRFANCSRQQALHGWNVIFIPTNRSCKSLRALGRVIPRWSETKSHYHGGGSWGRNMALFRASRELNRQKNAKDKRNKRETGPQITHARLTWDTQRRVYTDPRSGSQVSRVHTRTLACISWHAFLGDAWQTFKFGCYLFLAETRNTLFKALVSEIYRMQTLNTYGAQHTWTWVVYTNVQLPKGIFGKYSLCVHAGPCGLLPKKPSLKSNRTAQQAVCVTKQYPCTCFSRAGCFCKMQVA